MRNTENGFFCMFLLAVECFQRQSDYLITIRGFTLILPVICKRGEVQNLSVCCLYSSYLVDVV